MRPGKWPWNNEKNIVSSEEVHTNRKDDTAINSKIKNSQKNPKLPGTSVTPVKDFDSVAATYKEHLTKDSLKSNNKKEPKQKTFSLRDSTILSPEKKVYERSKLLNFLYLICKNQVVIEDITINSSSFSIR